MALMANFQVNGIMVNGGYIKVQDLFCTKDRIEAGVGFKASSSDLPVKIEKYNFIPDMDGGNFIKQTYEYLKTLPEFTGAIDC
jgi:hypothetical protein